ncbi:hypothetical protein COS50_00520 [Candidatus Roizmanbacteria bacterium CG03_land_8_20_14_0_80_35_26]|uniref:F-type ATPase subunit b n=2 Tax=Candidatus Roizmaniibacteriota TaxID=1752723 RepID=A0A2M7BXR5_9BACT|nr:MAG: hypothetical protein COV86_02645 [Candidatus Roizmanbacteria bacterium CG11_big_fil_rev_8_21_14_0_20_35_14]PIV11367.1 MAG: hypothetical protein COS50_00520 [Candidatus Roizmanbacteria bacterium CG03_land_8_20_14_0_80_35_26]
MESLGIDIKLLIAQIINFGLFFYVFKKYLAKPFASFMSDEAKLEKEKERIMEDLKKKEEELTTSQNKAKNLMKKELDAALKKVKEDAARLKANLIVEAKKDSQVIIDKGKKQIEVERAEMEREMKKKIVQLTGLVLERSFSSYLSSDMQKEVNKNVLKNLPKLS